MCNQLAAQRSYFTGLADARRFRPVACTKFGGRSSRPAAGKEATLDSRTPRLGSALALGALRPLEIASEEVKVLGGFIVPEAGGAVVTLDFDAASSLVHRGDGDWLLTPVIVRVD